MEALTIASLIIVAIALSVLLVSLFAIIIAINRRNKINAEVNERFWTKRSDDEDAVKQVEELKAQFLADPWETVINTVFDSFYIKGRNYDETTFVECINGSKWNNREEILIELLKLKLDYYQNQDET